MVRTSLRRSLVVILAACTLAALPAAILANHSWGGYHWARTSNPFTLKLGDNVSSAWDSYLATTSSDWSVSTELDTTIVAGQANPKNCRPTSGRVEACNSTYGNNGWLGLAQIWISGKHITQGIVKVNDTYFNTSTYDTPGWRHLVMCQEVGHTLGLDHQDTNFNNTNLGTCMDYTSNPYGPPDNEHPNQHDYDELVTIYTHLDSTTTVGSAAATGHMPPAMGQIEFETPAQWGKLIRGSRESGASVHELDFGGGHKVFTFVIWARQAGQ
ncbi:MAG: hypothetical protein HY237_11835 [Acidobacteria bacterium]|nr:hypothetical protein [Acidobacteriota bacterium]